MMPAEADVTAGFDAAASGYDTHGVDFFTTIARRLVAEAGLKTGWRVLDAGCGAGAATVPAAVTVGPGGHVTGIDLSARMLARCRAICAGLRLDNVTLARANAHRPPYAAGSFDAVIASMMVFLLADPAGAFRSWLRLLRPGGVLAFSWNAGEDPGWRPVIAAVDSFVPDGRGFDRLLHHPPFGGLSDVAGVLASVGYTGITTTVAAAEARYAGPRHWWAASWSQAPRVVWDAIPEDRRMAARDDAFRILDGLREPDGSLVRRSSIGYTVARLASDDRRGLGGDCG
jgi:ubiquinone/menaquinone biosynthesis C-methylase UbiE